MEDRNLARYSPWGRRVGRHLVTEQELHAKLLHSFLLFATLWAATYQAPLFMGFSRQECWSGWPCPPPGNLPDPGIELVSPALAGRFIITGTKGYVILLKVVPCPLPSCFILPSDFSPVFLWKAEG